MPINIASSLVPTTVNTPIDSRCVVATVADIANINMPYVGLRVYCLATSKEYRVLTLKNKTIGALDVQNAAVNTYAEIPESSNDQDIEDTLDAILAGSSVPVLTACSELVSSIAAGSNVSMSVTNGTLTISATGGGGSSSGSSGSGGGAVSSASALLCLCQSSPASPVDGMIWVKGGTSTPQYFAAVGGVTILTSTPASIASAADGTIVVIPEEE